MKTMTIRNIPDDVAKELKTKADKGKTSVNTAVVQVLTENVRPAAAKKRRHDFSAYCGGWSKQERKQFDESVSTFEEVKSEDWK